MCSSDLLLDHRRERSARTDAEHAAFLVEAQRLEIASEHDGHACKALIGDEHVAAPTEHRPRRSGLFACPDQARKRSDGIDLHEEARRTAYPIARMARERLAREHLPIEGVGDEERLNRRGMTGSHSLYALCARRRRPSTI